MRSTPNTCELVMSGIDHNLRKRQRRAHSSPGYIPRRIRTWINSYTKRKGHDPTRKESPRGSGTHVCLLAQRGQISEHGVPSKKPGGKSCSHPRKSTSNRNSSKLLKRCMTVASGWGCGWVHTGRSGAVPFCYKFAIALAKTAGIHGLTNAPAGS